MLDRLSKPWWLLLIPVVALALFLSLYFYFYRGTYDPPPSVTIPFERISAPSSSFTTFTEVPPIREGTLLVDGIHGNRFTKDEISALVSRVADRGYDIEFVGDEDPFGGFRSLSPRDRLSLLEEKLRLADSLAVILPAAPYSQEEVGLIERYVAKGGRLLLIGDPTRESDINTLAERFGIAFQPGYLYNMVEHDRNFKNIFVKNFLPDEVTNGLSQVALYTAGSIRTFGAGLAFADANTRSTIVEDVEPLYPMVRAGDGQVLAISDLTFMIPPQNAILDNDRLVSNIADFLTAGQREFELADFPHFFEGDVDILLGRADIFDVGTQVRSMLSSFHIASEPRAVEDLANDTVFLGLYQDSADVAQYLEVAGVHVGDTLRTPFTPDIVIEGTAIVLLHTSSDRQVLVVLGDSQAQLAQTVAALGSGQFRSGLVSDSLGVFK